MNKLVFPILTALLLSACQNTPKSAADTPLVSPDNKSKADIPATQAAPDLVASATVQSIAATFDQAIKTAENLRKQVDALPANVRKEKAADIESMYATLEGLIEKQKGMLNELKTFQKPENAAQEGGAGISTSQLKEYSESAARYAQDAQAIQDAVKKLGGSK